jgi:hypothetical protein
VNKQLIYHTIVPKYNANVSTDFRIDPNFDLKVSFLFDHFQKLSTPWIVVYDSVGRKSLKKLDIVFTHDQYEILKVDFKTKCEIITTFPHVFLLLIFCSFSQMVPNSLVLTQLTLPCEDLSWNIIGNLFKKKIYRWAYKSCLLPQCWVIWSCCSPCSM